MIKVIFIPDVRKGNPYQKALADSLLKQGVDVGFGTVFWLFSALRAAKNHWKPDILHLHWHHPLLLGRSTVKTVVKSVSFMGELLILKLFGIKIVWTVHNIVSHEGKYRCLELFFSKLLPRVCNKIIIHTLSAKNEVMNTYRVAKDSLITVIPHGNYIHSYENAVSKTEARKQLQLDTEDTIFLYFGLIRPYKGILELIDAFKRLNSPKAKLLIVGKPRNPNNEIAGDIKKKCSGNKSIKVTFDFISDDKIQIYMNAADVVLLPYRNILTSGAVILAMSFVKPVIAPAIGCIPDVLDSEGSFLYNPSGEGSLLRAMQCALDTDLINMGKHNFELAEKLGWDNIAKTTYDIYQECLAK